MRFPSGDQDGIESEAGLLMKFTGPVPLALITHISKLLKAMRLPSGDLDRHVAIEGGLIGLVDSGHSAPSKLRDDLIVAKRPTNETLHDRLAELFFSAVQSQHVGNNPTLPPPRS